VQQFLGAVRHATVTDLAGGPSYRISGAGAPAGAPAAQDIWAVKAAGAGTQSLTWNIDNGDWTLVVMKPDAGAGVDATVAVGAEVPGLDWIGPLLLVVGAVGLAVAALVLTLVIRGAARR
jgi:hypothetical protein